MQPLGNIQGENYQFSTTPEKRKHLFCCQEAKAVFNKAQHNRFYQVLCGTTESSEGGKKMEGSKFTMLKHQDASNWGIRS